MMPHTKTHRCQKGCYSSQEHNFPADLPSSSLAAPTFGHHISPQGSCVTFPQSTQSLTRAPGGGQLLGSNQHHVSDRDRDERDKIEVIKQLIPLRIISKGKTWETLEVNDHSRKQGLLDYKAKKTRLAKSHATEDPWTCPQNKKAKVEETHSLPSELQHIHDSWDTLLCDH